MEIPGRGIPGPVAEPGETSRDGHTQSRRGRNDQSYTKDYRPGPDA
jgi:hypothetical protein